MSESSDGADRIEESIRLHLRTAHEDHGNVRDHEGLEYLLAELDKARAAVGAVAPRDEGPRPIHRRAMFVAETVLSLYEQTGGAVCHDSPREGVPCNECTGCATRIALLELRGALRAPGGAEGEASAAGASLNETDPRLAAAHLAGVVGLVHEVATEAIALEGRDVARFSRAMVTISDLAVGASGSAAALRDEAREFRCDGCQQWIPEPDLLTSPKDGSRGHHALAGYCGPVVESSAREHANG